MINVIYCILVAWFITDFKPIQKIINMLVDKTKKEWVKELLYSLSCWKCMAFWITLTITQTAIYAIAAAFIAYLTSLILDSL